MERRRFGPLPRRAVRLAAIAGIFFAGDLTFWHHAIEYVGAGLATVLGNLQVLIVGVIFLGLVAGQVLREPVVRWANLPVGRIAWPVLRPVVYAALVVAVVVFDQEAKAFVYFQF